MNLKTLNIKTIELQRLLLALVFLLLAATPGWSQNVIINAGSGDFITALTTSTETGFASGFSSSWKHYQLRLTMAAADDNTLTSGRQLQTHACNLAAKRDLNSTLYASSTDILWFGGMNNPSYLTITLPRGYRFTRYIMVFDTDVDITYDSSISSSSQVNPSHTGSLQLEEMDSLYQTSKKSTGTIDNSSTRNTTEQITLARQANDMGNTLYFRLKDNTQEYFAVNLKSIEVWFTPEEGFTASFPSSSDASSEGKSYVTSTFKTGLTAYGPITNNLKNGVSKISYQYSNVKDMDAAIQFYEQGLVEDDYDLNTELGDKSITTFTSDGNYYYNIEAGKHYFVEVPSYTTDGYGNEFPMHYRIVSAKIRYVVETGKSAEGKIYARTKTVNPDELTAENADVSTEIASSGTIELTGLNNDAFEFYSTNGDVKVAFDVEMQPLDPYVSHVEISCAESSTEAGAIAATQGYNSDNFQFGNQNIYFYVPSSKKNETFTVEFKNLKCDYADNTYGDASSTYHSRYNFVKSDFYSHFYDTTMGINRTYFKKEDNANNPDNLSRTSTVWLGTQPYKLNNALEISQMTTGSTYFMEYRFEESRYESTEGTLSGIPGAFEKVTLTPTDEEAVKHVFLFVADNPRYLISPYWNGKRHRKYAFYDTNIHIVAKDYKAKADFKKIYSNALYYDETTKSFKQRDYYGVAIHAIDSVTGEEMSEGSRYCSVEIANSVIKDSVEKANTNQTANMPWDKKQILYVDLNTYLDGTFSEASTTEAAEEFWYNFRDKFSPNAFIFLAPGREIPLDNFCAATKTAATYYDAGKDVVLTDRQPFYSPYYITVGPANKITYTRLQTASNYTYVMNTLMLPFSVNLNEGVYQDETNNNELEFYSMKTSDFLGQKNTSETVEQEGTKYVGYFNALTGNTEANVPYLVTITGNDNVAKPFEIVQYGAYIVPTPVTDATTETACEYEAADKATGTAFGTTYNLTFTGTYKGYKVSDVFYYANDHFYNSNNLTGYEQKAWILPFRGYIKHEGISSAKMNSFLVSFNDDTATGIDDITTTASDTDLRFVGGSGSLQMISGKDQIVTIYSVSGILNQRVELKSGESQTINLVPGIYVVNGQKVVIH